MLRMSEAIVGYDEKRPILKDIVIDIDMTSRIAIVGPKGAGKTTLLKALRGDLEVNKGYYFRHNRVRIGMFTQHHVDSLDLRLSPVEQMMDLYPGNLPEKFRNYLGSFGISGNLGIRPMYLLSGGQKSRVALAIETFKNVSSEA